MKKTAIIIGAGPAGLTAAYELLERSDITPIILEKSGIIGGISRTISYKGNRMDMGPHRFFSKSDRVMNWWLKMMPLEKELNSTTKIYYQNQSREIDTKNSTTADNDKVMLIIKRMTRIYFLRKFFSYPIQLGISTLRSLGFKQSMEIILSYIMAKFFPIKKETSLEDFFINRFGKKLYTLFFKDYTEKVWGVPCNKISAEWGAQRIKGVSLQKAILNSIKRVKIGNKNSEEISQKGTETSLIEQFLYPKYGPGSLWEEVAQRIISMGGEIHFNQDVHEIKYTNKLVTYIKTIDAESKKIKNWSGDYFFSTMPVQELIEGMGESVPYQVREVAKGLQYRDFINVGVLLKQLSAPENDKSGYTRLELKDNWIYVQESDVKVGRIMIYNNWGGGMVKDKDTTWIGMEYFCNKEDELWQKCEEEIKALAISELQKLSLCQDSDILDATVSKMEKTYPAYFGSYPQFGLIKEFTDDFENLFLVGRNGMHKYNNADHSMLTSMVSVDNIISGITTKQNIWSINTEQEYHEEKKEVTSESKEKSVSILEILIKKNKILLTFTFFITLLQFYFFKIKFPFANFLPDSYSYLEAAASNADVNKWPIAYSKFLRLISTFTHSDVIVTGIQYLILQFSGLIFVLSIIIFLKPKSIISYTLVFLILFNPIAPYVANYISSDSLFISLSFLWITSLLWVIFKPHKNIIYVHAILLLACFMIRYNAIYYPIISIITFSISPTSRLFKFSGIAFSIICISLSFFYTSQKMLEVSGKKQFSAFGGWQLASNAIYMYEHIPKKDRKKPPGQLTLLDNMVRQHIDTLQKVKLTSDDSLYMLYYLWNTNSPLIQYMKQQNINNKQASNFQKWASEGPIYSKYGAWLIKNYPLQYAKTFLLPNSAKFVTPPPEFLDIYNMGEDTVGKPAKDWFNYKSQIIQRDPNQGYISVTKWYPIFNVVANTLCLICLIGFITFKKLDFEMTGLRRLIILLTTFWLINFLFSISASPIVLRYQLFPLFAILFLSIPLADLLYRSIVQQENRTLNYNY